MTKQSATLFPAILDLIGCVTLSVEKAKESNIDSESEIDTKRIFSEAVDEYYHKSEQEQKDIQADGIIKFLDWLNK